MWFAWKFVPLWYQQQLYTSVKQRIKRCDLLENSYLCGISNNRSQICFFALWVVICLKIRTFVVSATTELGYIAHIPMLWFAWKFVPLWYQQQQFWQINTFRYGCDLLENSYLCGISNNSYIISIVPLLLWFAWKFVPLWYQQQLKLSSTKPLSVVICLKIRTFVVSATTRTSSLSDWLWLWFAWKFVPLWYQQQPSIRYFLTWLSCDLLENSYLCGISNNCNIRLVFHLLLWFAWKFVPLWYQQQHVKSLIHFISVVICLKIRTFVVSATTLSSTTSSGCGCDLLENSYLCGISNNSFSLISCISSVVICLKIRTFVVSATTKLSSTNPLS